MANYRNLDGTTKKSFKIGTNGVMLTSTAMVDEHDSTKITKYLVTNQKIPGLDTYYRVAYEDPNNTIYDTFIQSSDILSFNYGTDDETGREYISFNIRTNAGGTGQESIKIYTTLPEGLGDVYGPSSSTDEAIVLYDGTSGKVIKDSGRHIVDASDITLEGILSEEINDSTDVPSVGAVCKIIGVVSDPLKDTLEGLGEYLIRRRGGN